MKNFYYERTRKTFEYFYGKPPHIRRSGQRHYISRNAYKYQDVFDIFHKVATVAIETTFCMAIHHYDDHIANKPYADTSIGQMEALVERYTKRNPSFTFSFDPNDRTVDHFDAHGDYLYDDNTKRITRARQAFGTACYRRFADAKIK